MPIERDVQTLLSLLSAEALPVDPKLWASQDRQAATSILWNDLRSKAVALPDYDGQTGALQKILSWAGKATGRTPTKGANMPTDGTFADESRPVDVLVLCPLAKELNAALIAFDIDPLKDEDANYQGRKVFFTRLQRGARRPLSVAVSVFTQPRNVPASLATTHLSLRLKPSAVILSGIGGGVKRKVALGDVVVATSVRDVAGGRDEPGRRRMRDEIFTVPGPTDAQLNYFVASPLISRANQPRLEENLAALRAHNGFKMPSELEVKRAKLSITDGIIIAGETLVADGSLPSHLDTRDDRIRSCDMEGSGFVQAAIEQSLNWAVFRGISDFGDPKKTDKWQAIAALQAASAARSFLETQFRLQSEMAETGF